MWNGLCKYPTGKLITLDAYTQMIHKVSIKTGIPTILFTQTGRISCHSQLTLSIAAEWFTHSATWTDPLSIRNFWQGWVKAVDVV